MNLYRLSLQNCLSRVLTAIILIYMWFKHTKIAQLDYCHCAAAFICVKNVWSHHTVCLLTSLHAPQANTQLNNACIRYHTNLIIAYVNLWVWLFSQNKLSWSGYRLQSKYHILEEQSYCSSRQEVISGTKLCWKWFLYSISVPLFNLYFVEFRGICLCLSFPCVSEIVHPWK